ncbi:unnamed protein product [Anisakis simplex]|uniref:Apple domain-containing protein n=1 Tax=Anisakis simplex TaxID=6269 RepID=A0A0M3JU45_ANISI|nr:unnamed protein product [Anisakis simplex]
MNGYALTDCNLQLYIYKDGCVAVVYHKNVQTCQLYNHDGSAEIVFAVGHDYYNRTSFSDICQDRQHRCSAENEVIGYFLVDGFKVSTSAESSRLNGIEQAMCAAYCTQNISVTYKQNNGLCLLHDVTPEHDPRLMLETEGSADRAGSTVVIENGCDRATRTISRAVVEWSEWSDCEFGVAGERARVRSRECAQPICADLQVQSCN